MKKTYTYTLNPAIDQFTQAKLRLYELNILPEITSRPAGKGINVSRLLWAQGIASVVSGFLGGANGLWIQEQLEAEGLECRFIATAGNTRANLKINDGLRCTELNQKGPVIRHEEKEKLLQSLNQLDPGDLLVLSGSIPPGLDEGILRELVYKAHQQSATVILDSSGPAFLQALAASPDYIKPNNHELEEIFKEHWPEDFSFDSISTMAKLAHDLLVYYRLQGILLSLGKEGACMITDSQAWYAPGFQLPEVYPTGAGDSMVAAMASVLSACPVGTKADGKEILEQAMYFSAACCLNPDDLLSSPKQIEQLKKEYPLSICELPL